MASWEYRAYDADLNVSEGTEEARSFPELAFMLRQRGLQILEATKLNQDNTLAAKRMAKMKARVDGPEDHPVETGSTMMSAIRKLLSVLIPPFLKRSNVPKEPGQGP